VCLCLRASARVCARTDFGSVCERLWMRVLTTSIGAATVIDATAPPTDAIDV
jgi:hypothetical protein